MNNFLYAMKESFGRMQKEIHIVLKKSTVTDRDKNELFLRVGNCLQSILLPFVVKERFFSRLAVHYFVCVSLCILLQLLRE